MIFSRTVADRLFARDVRRRAENGGEKAGRLSRALFCVPAPRTESWAPRLGVDIDEAPVDLAPRRAVAQRVDGLIERRVGEHRAVDQHRILGHAGGKLLRQYPFEKRLAARPFDMVLVQQPVELARRKGREGTGKTRGRARRENQFGEWTQDRFARASKSRWSDGARPRQHPAGC